jgi:hypothetical protein
VCCWCDCCIVVAGTVADGRGCGYCDVLAIVQLGLALQPHLFSGATHCSCASLSLDPWATWDAKPRLVVHGKGNGAHGAAAVLLRSMGVRWGRCCHRSPAENFKPSNELIAMT